MTPVERLEAALAKLDALRGAVPESGDLEWREHGRAIIAYDDTVVAADLMVMDQQMILTLHRTIPALLAILRAALDDYERYGKKPSKFFENDLALADAILGGDPS